MTEKVITVGGRKLTVRRKTFGDQLRRFSMMEAAQLDPPYEGEGLEAVIRNGFHRATYPSLASCTTGAKVPTEPECFDSVPNDDLEAWLEAARECNPDWFPVPDEEESAEKNG